jgi:PAS domain S-box-containing protein
LIAAAFLESFQNIARLLPEPLLLVDDHSAVAAANRAGAQVLGAGVDTIVGTLLLELADEPLALRSYLAQCARTTSLIPGLLTLRCQPRTRYRVEGARFDCGPGSPAAVLLRLGERSQASRSFAALNEQIAELNREIGRRTRIEHELRRQEQWLRVTLSSIGDGVIATGTDGRVLFLNPAAEKLTGWSQHEAAGRPMDEIFRIVHEATRVPVPNPAERVLREGVVVGLANHTLLLSRNGSEWPIADSAAPIRDDEGEVQGVVLVFLEISGRKQVEDQLRKQADDLLDADRRKDEYLAMLAHELRNPLGAVSNALYLLDHATPGSPPFERAKDIARRQIALQERMVDDLLDVSRITRGTFSLRCERIELGELLRRSCEDASLGFEQAGIAFSRTIADDEVWVEADAARLTQALSNLFDNARKFTQAGGRVDLSLETDRASNVVIVTVRDDGAGIAQELLPHVFEPFRQGEQSLARSSGGLGLGLALVRGVLRLHGGDASVDSGPHGSAFRLTLPLP